MRDWLTVRPVAHRGLHDSLSGVIENTPSAFVAAIASNYAIECDVQITSDGEAMVYHDDELGRLTEGTAKLARLSASELKRVEFKSTSDRMLTLGELCSLVSGAVTLFIEIKSRFDGDLRLASRTAQVLAGYKGPVAVMSFDPQPMRLLKELAPNLTRGLVAQRLDQAARSDHDTADAHGLSYARNALAARLQFLAYRVKDLPSVVPLFAQGVMRLPLLTWTVRTPQDQSRAARWADQIIFEGIRP